MACYELRMSFPSSDPTRVLLTFGNDLDPASNRHVWQALAGAKPLLICYQPFGGEPQTGGSPAELQTTEGSWKSLRTGRSC